MTDSLSEPDESVQSTSPQKKTAEKPTLNKIQPANRLTLVERIVLMRRNRERRRRARI